MDVEGVKREGRGGRTKDKKIKGILGSKVRLLRPGVAIYRNLWELRQWSMINSIRRRLVGEAWRQETITLYN